MIDVEPLIADAFERLYPAPEPVEKWAAVLTDAGLGRGALRRRRLVQSVARRRILVPAIAGAVFLLAGGALAVTLTLYSRHHSQWLAVVNDYLDDRRVEGRYTCADARDALSKVKGFDARGTADPRVGVRLPTKPFEDYVRSVCR